MSTKVKFGNKTVQLPGSYSRIVSGQNNPPRDLDYGKLLIIDNNELDSNVSGFGMLGGAGVNGELSQGIKSIYSLKDIKEFRDFCGAGWWQKAAEGLFNPDGKGNGISEALVIKPATTTCANMTFTATGGGAAGGSFKIKTLDESGAANGVTDETRAQSSVTITSAGATADKITVKVNGVTVAEYTNAASDSIATFVAGLASNFTSRGICAVVSSTSPTIIFKAPVGTGGTTVTPTITATGTATATTIAFSGGVTSTSLTGGYAYTIETGVININKWILKVWRSSYTGLYSDGIPYDEITSDLSTPVLIVESVEFDNIQTLIDWAKGDSTFAKYLYLDPTSAKVGTGTVNSSDVLLVPGFQAATGGSANYDSIDDALDAIKELNYNYILTTYVGVEGDDDPTVDGNIIKIVDHISNEAKYDKYLIIGGSYNDIDDSISFAEEFDTEKVNLVHGGIKKSSQMSGSGFRQWGSFFHAAYYAGRLLGMAPEVPLTFKAFDIEGVVDELTDKNKLKADSAGVLVTYYDSDFGKFINLHDVNTIQNNSFVLNNDGTSHLIQIERIKAQLNKELIINSKLDLLSDPTGVNRSSLTNADLVEWTKVYLQRKLGTLLTDYRNVTAVTQQDVIFCDYEASPNTEIKGIFFTGRLYV